MHESVTRGGDDPGSPVVEDLGVVSTSSGEVVLIDFGLLRLWSGEDVPVLGDDDVGPTVASTANTATDLQIVGADPVAAGSATDLAVVRGRYVFDVPAEQVERMRTDIADRCRQAGFDVQVEPIPRMPHRARVARLLDDSPSGAEVVWHGGWAVAVRGLPLDTQLPVRGVRMPLDGPDAGNWHSVSVEVTAEVPARTEDIGYVLVDEARLAFADPDALTDWRTGESVDGLADVVFWGRDVETLAERSDAPALDEHVYGWRDLPLDDALDRAHELQRIRESGDLAFAFDFRPHDDHYRLLRHARTAPTESASIEIDGRIVCGFFTSWGDGAFPVRRDLDANGALCRVRVELGAPEIVARQRRFEERWSGPLSKVALVSARVARDGDPAGWLYREAPDHETDSGWRVFAGDETQDYLDDDTNVVLVPLRDLVDRDPALEAALAAEAPAAFERDQDGVLRPTAAPAPEDG